MYLKHLFLKYWSCVFCSLCVCVCVFLKFCEKRKTFILDFWWQFHYHCHSIPRCSGERDQPWLWICDISLWWNLGCLGKWRCSEIYTSSYCSEDATRNSKWWFCLFKNKIISMPIGMTLSFVLFLFMGIEAKWIFYPVCSAWKKWKCYYISTWMKKKNLF